MVFIKEQFTQKIGEDTVGNDLKFFDMNSRISFCGNLRDLREKTLKDDWISQRR